MHFKIALILSGILILITSVCNAQRIKKCDSDSECILLKSCREMSDLIASKIRENIERVRNNICGFRARESKVCCPTTKSSLPVIGHPAKSVSLLPAVGKCGRPAADDKIIFGTPSAIGAYPWIAALGYTAPGRSEPSFICAGSIINERYVLTAAHCLDASQLGGRRLSVIHLGDYNLANSGRDCEQTRFGQRCNTPHIVAGFEETVSHPMYNKRAITSDDIALIRLDRTLNFESNLATIGPVCLPPNGFDFKTFAGNEDPIAAGWGITEHGNTSNILLQASVPIADESLCRERYGKRFVGNQLCIGGGEGGTDTCSGDSGGPLIMGEKGDPPFFQVGIVSFGPFPCRQFPGVYTNVADYRNWIIDNMRP